MATMIDLVHEAEWRWADLADVLARIDANGGCDGADAGPTRAMLKRLYGSAREEQRNVCPAARAPWLKESIQMT